MLFNNFELSENKKYLFKNTNVFYNIYIMIGNHISIINCD